MLNSHYRRLKLEFFANFKDTEKTIKEIEQMREKFPVSVAKELYCGMICRIEAEKKLSQGNEEGATIEMEKAVWHSRWALFDVLKLYLLIYLCDTRNARISYRGHEDLAYKYIPNYIVHSQTLFATRGLIRSKKLFNEEPEEVVTREYRDRVLCFLTDFEALKPVLFSAMNKEKEAKVMAQKASKYSRINIVVSALCVIGASVLSSFFSRPTQPEPSTSETELQSAENNPTPNP